jgi:hypothetical protein
MFLTATDLSPAQASTARTKEPIPAARIAAKPEPFVKACELGAAERFD